MTIPKEGNKMALTRRNKAALRMSAIITTTLITATVSIIGAVVAVQGGDFWVWVWMMCAMYALELMFAGVAAILHYNSISERRKRDFYRRRREQRVSRVPL